MSTASEVIDLAATLLGDENKDYFSQSLMLKFFNQAAKEISQTSKAIAERFQEAKVLGQYQYPLMDTFLRVEMVMIGTDQPPLRKAGIFGIETDRTWRTSGTPRQYTTWGKKRLERVSSTATSGSSTTCDDTAVDFTMGVNQVYIGDRFKNKTDDSEAVITTIATTKLTFSGGLAGGVDDTVATSDTYEVLSAHAPLHTLIIHPAPAESDVTGTESIRALCAVKERTITQADIDNTNDGLSIDEDLDTALLHKTMYYARGFEQGFDSAQAIAQFGLSDAAYKKHIGDVRKRFREDVSLWQNQFILSDFVITESSYSPGSYLGFS